MINLSKQKRVTPEVFYPSETNISIARSIISDLKNIALENPRARARLCVHETPEAIIQQMFIVHPFNTYVRPHRHKIKEESILVLEGTADLLIFGDSDNVEKCVNLSDYSSGGIFFHLMPPNIYHSLIIKTEWFAFVEVTKGPFRKQDTEFAPWSPTDSDTPSIQKYLRHFSTG